MDREQIVTAILETEQEMLKKFGIKTSGESIHVIAMAEETPIVSVKGDSELIRRMLSYTISWCMEMAMEAGRDQEQVERWARKISEDAITISKL